MYTNLLMDLTKLVPGFISQEQNLFTLLAEDLIGSIESI